MNRSTFANSVLPYGEYALEHWRRGRMIDLYRVPNGVADEGKNNVLDTNFNSGTQRTIWWMSLINSVGYTALAAGDTYQHINTANNGWSEFTSYTNTSNNNDAGTRPQWANDIASGQTITNTTKTLFNITIAGTIKGVLLVGGPTAYKKGDNSSGNTLWSTALFLNGDVSVIAADQLRATYTITL
jgi:hypothetical protein